MIMKTDVKYVKTHSAEDNIWRLQDIRGVEQHLLRGPGGCSLPKAPKLLEIKMEIKILLTLTST